MCQKPVFEKYVKMKRIIISVVFMVCAGALIVVCLNLFSSSQEERQEILIHCGAGIRPVAEEIIKRFESEKGIRVLCNYAGGGKLVSEICLGQKGDLFMPGARFYIDTVKEKDLVYTDTEKTVFYFVPVIFVRKGNPFGIACIKDLTKKGIRVGIGARDACAVGRRTVKIFEKNNIPYEVISQNIVYESATVNELPAAVKLGSVDAVVCWDANAGHFTEWGTIVPIPRKENVVSIVSVVMLKCTSHPEYAKQLIDYITSDEAKQILLSNGYTVSL